MSIIQECLSIFVIFVGVSNIYAQVYRIKGSSVQLNCTLRASSNTGLFWHYRNSYATSTKWLAYTANDYIDQRFPISPRLNLTGDSSRGEYNLVINNLIKEDEGYYRCSVTNGGEIVQQLVIIVGPSSVALQKTDNKLFGTEGMSLQITCTAIGGNPAPDVQIWMYGSTVSNGKQKATYTTPTLLRSDDGQTVTCRAGYTQINSLPKTDSADIYLNLKPLSTSISQGPVSVVEYEHLVISCTSTGSRPAVVFNWDIGGANITDSSVITSRTLDHPSNTYTVISTLTFNVTKDDNEQQLTCKAINIAASNGVSAGPINVDVKYPPTVTVDDKIFTDDTFPEILTCNADGNPDTYTFYQWTQSLQGTTIRNLNDTRDGTLTLPNINKTLRYQNAGKYTCTVGNGIPKAATKRSGSGFLTINAPPVFALYNNLKQGGEIRKTSNISAYVYSVPALVTFVWYNGSVEVRGTGYKTSSSQTTVTVMFHGKEIIVDGFMVTLTFDAVKESDFITYVVRVGNSRGSSEQNISFESSSAPDPPKNLSVIDQTDHSITVQWKAGYDGGHKQTFFILFRQHGTGTWMTLMIPKRIRGHTNQLHDFRIGGLQHSTKYEIKMFANNTIDRSAETKVEIGVTDTKLDGGSSGAVIGGVVGGLSVGIIILIAVVVIMKRRKRSGGHGKKKIPRGDTDSDGEEGLKDNILYKSVDTGSSKSPEAASSEYAEVQKPSDVYAEVSKAKPQKDTKDKKQKGKKAPGNRKQKPKVVNNNSAAMCTNQSEYGNVGNPTGGYINADGLQYADITFINPPKTKPGKAGKHVIHGLDDRTIYSDVDLTKKAPPLPQEGAYELTDIGKGKQS